MEIAEGFDPPLVVPTRACRRFPALSSPVRYVNRCIFSQFWAFALLFVWITSRAALRLPSFRLSYNSRWCANRVFRMLWPRKRERAARADWRVPASYFASLRASLLKFFITATRPPRLCLILCDTASTFDAAPTSGYMIIRHFCR
ncbi:hypothetical protein PsYK624_134810 [Phanerochaete sordida]|uniref:Uncharacterized protein n=1 Tax=Phanerochaete sordida TaxID=48140 RepID=A0A9P3GL39_9APHY|nr:hypothetical protein PsYK624_134810 [Phanerochaete sordida]